MKYKKELMLSLFGLFLIGVVSAGLCEDTGCPESWCTATPNMICDGGDTYVDINPGDKLFCEFGGDFAEWVNITSRYTVTTSLGSGISCEQLPEDREGGSPNPCCPIDSACRFDFFGGDEQENGCRDEPSFICGNYTDELNCINNPGSPIKSAQAIFGFNDENNFCMPGNEQISGIWKNASGSDCVSKLSGCSCKWVTDSSPEGGICKFKYTNESECGDGFIEEGHCEYKLIAGSWDESACTSGGSISAEWSAVWINSSGDEDPGSAALNCAETTNNKIPCTMVTRLSFFSFFNIILAVLGIIGIYIFKKD